MQHLFKRLKAFLQRTRAQELEDDYRLEQGELLSAQEISRDGRMAVWQSGPYGAGQAPHIEDTRIGPRR